MGFFLLFIEHFSHISKTRCYLAKGWCQRILFVLKKKMKQNHECADAFMKVSTSDAISFWFALFPCNSPYIHSFARRISRCTVPIQNGRIPPANTNPTTYLLKHNIFICLWFLFLFLYLQCSVMFMEYFISCLYHS